MDLKKQSGLQITLKGGIIYFTKNMLHQPLTIRTLKEARKFLENKNSSFKSLLSKNSTTRSLKGVLYLMYRNISKKEDLELFKKYKGQYDITVIYPGTEGKEYNRTIGHQHIGNYPEIYEVLCGNAIFIFQKYLNGRIKEIYAISAGQGEKVIVPPGFGHISINPSNKILILGNLWKSGIKSDYSLFDKKNGAGWYIIKSKVKSQKLKLEKDLLAVEKNPNYKKSTELMIGTPKEVKKLGIDFKKPLYSSFAKNPKKFSWLKNPKEFNKLKAKDLFHIKY